MVTLVRLPGYALAVGVPAGWKTEVLELGGILAVEATCAAPPATLSVLLDLAEKSLDTAASVASLAAFVAPVLLDVAQEGDHMDLLFCHVIGPASVTVRQRQVLTQEGLVAITVSAETTRWPEIAPLAEDITSSLQVTR